jgi:CheY-like chemotaxis protein
MNAYPHRNRHASLLAELTDPRPAAMPITFHGASVASPALPTQLLVLDNDPQSRNALAEQLRAFGLEPLPVADSLAALNAITLRPPALILMACDQPDVPGYESTMRAAVEKQARRLHIPIILVSNAPDAYGLSLEGTRIGILQRPLHAEQLQALLHRWVEQSASDIGRCWQELLAEDVEGFGQALAERDEARMIRFAHRLLDALRVLEARRAAELANRLEQAARGKLPMEPGAMRATLAALKEAIVRHFA